MSSRRTTLIAGAGLAGSRCAENLRSFAYDGRILLVGAEAHAPYERPALSKGLLAGVRDDVSLRPASFWDERDIELVLNTRVESIDPVRRVATVGGDRIAWDSLVIATGTQPRRLAGPRGVHHLRTLDDALRLRADLDERSRVVIVGAGFIGGEVASTLVDNVASVTVVEPRSAPLERVLGPEVGGILARHHRARGIDLRLGVGVSGFEGDATLERVRLTTGDAIEADAVVVGIGNVGDTIEVDEFGRSAKAGVYACGDAAAWWRAGERRHIRTEHWTSAAGQARAVATAIVGQPQPFDEPPFFWSDQLGLRLQYVGNADHWHAVVLAGDEDSFTARYVDDRGRLLAALAVNSAASVSAFRRELAA